MEGRDVIDVSDFSPLVHVDHCPHPLVFHFWVLILIRVKKSGECEVQ